MREPLHGVEKFSRDQFFRIDLWREHAGFNFLRTGLANLWRRLRRGLAARPARQLRVRETLALGEKRQLLIVECGDRQLLIGAAGNFLSMLAELPGEERKANAEAGE
ncbi:MAG TPA: flagellar biosynthetic protein FliO [Terriglobales bacterium]|jgi:hypothetical protein|nr:flagellar biosynthetic protein FliO [Terriglobales bacterium]